MRLIDADDVIMRHCAVECGCTREECGLTYEEDGCDGCTFVKEIENAPSVDAEPVITGETSDGYHTFNELYHHRAVLFSVIVKAFEAKAWKSRKHHDGTMYDGMFIVGIETPDGQATYHYDIEPYWDMFSCKEVESAPEWDGHTPTQAIERIGKLEPVRHAYWLPYNEYCNHAKEFQCAGLYGCGCYVSYDHYTRFCDYDYCPNCGAKMDGGEDSAKNKAD